MKIKTSFDTVVLNIIGYTVLGVMGIVCIFPFIMLISGSLTDESTILTEGYSLIPSKLSLEAYRVTFALPKILLDAYTITIFITIVGTALALFIITMTAYVISRKDFPLRNKITFYFYFTTLFSGGLVSYYIMMIRYYQLQDKLSALIIPGLVNVFYMLMMRNFITQSVHEALIESAKIDGAGDFRIFISIVFPVLKPALASIGLFIALGYWNDWYNAMLFLKTERLYPLQYVLYRILTTAQNMDLVASNARVNVQVPKESIKLAMTVIATGPIILAYPLVQKYFVKGITMGAVKG
jgi:putative aldouronate transport system permease protein